jgi:hypothetical protein
MFDTPNYRERADMHELLAQTTGDGAARAMHRAMAAEYRRKAEESSAASPPMSIASLAA